MKNYINNGGNTMNINKKIIRNIVKVTRFFTIGFFKNKKHLIFAVLLPFVLLMYFGFGISSDKFQYTFPATLSVLCISAGGMWPLKIISEFKSKKLESVFYSYKVTRYQLFFSFFLSSLLSFWAISAVLITISLSFYISTVYHYLLLFGLANLIFVFVFSLSTTLANLNKVNMKNKIIVWNIFFLAFLIFGAIIIPSYILNDKLDPAYKYIGYIFAPAGFANMMQIASIGDYGFQFKLTLALNAAEVITLVSTACIIYIKNSKLKLTYNEFSLKQNGVKLENLDVKIFNKKILRDLNLELDKGENMHLIGKSGAGKSVLYNSILERSLKFNCDISYISQELEFNFPNTIREITKLFISLSKAKKSLQRPMSADDALSNFYLTEQANLKFFQLSSGQKQKFKILISMLKKPNIIIMDEASTSLDPQSKKELFDFMEGISRSNNVSLFFTEHSNGPKLNEVKNVFLKEGSFDNDQQG